MPKPIQMIRAQFVPSTMNVEERTVDVVFATPTPVRRYSWMREEYYNEVLDMSGANLERATNGLPVLDNHGSWGSVGQILGRAKNVRREGESYIATVHFSTRDSLKDIVSDIHDGIISDVSFGYSVDKVERMEKTGDQLRTYMVREWTPNEISFVTIPADPKAGVRSEDNKNEGYDLPEMYLREHPELLKPQINKGQIMKREQMISMLSKRGVSVADNITDEDLAAEFERAFSDPGQDPESVRKVAIEAERKRSADITAAVRSAKLKPEFAEKLISDGKSIDEARALIIEEFAKNEPNKPVRGINVALVEGEADKVRSVMENALMLRVNPSLASTMKPEDVSMAREFRGMNLLRMAEDSLVRNGISTIGLSQREIATEAMGLGSRAMHTTSDFPIVLGEVFNKSLRSAYELNPRTFTPFCNRTSLSDFKTITKAQLSGLVGNFDQVLEGGEYKSGTMKEAKESYKLAKYGKKIAITWESIINDDLSALSRIPAAFAAKAAQKQSDIVYGILTGNPTMGDGSALFHVGNHKNYVSTGTALSEDSLDNAYQMFRVQKSIEGDFLNLSPKILVVGPKNERLAYKLTSTNFTPAKQSDITVPSLTGLQVVVEPRITDYAWFLAAQPSMIDTIEYAFLDGEQELFTEQRVGFDVDGIEIKARMVFAAKAIDYRGLFKNNGAQPA